MAHEHNPYRLGEDIEVVVPRTDLLCEVQQELMSGGGLGYLLGSWGVGKSVFLAQLHKQLQGIPGVQSLFFREPPMFRTIDALCRKLVDALLVDVPVEQGRLEPLRQDLYLLAEPLKVIDRYQNDVKPDPHVLVLLYDELNDYVDPSGFGREWFKRIESARKARSARLKVFATGGLGVFDIGNRWHPPSSHARAGSSCRRSRETSYARCLHLSGKEWVSWSMTRSSIISCCTREETPTSHSTVSTSYGSETPFASRTSSRSMAPS